MCDISIVGSNIILYQRLKNLVMDANQDQNKAKS